ncbi:DUF3801 domain-containing protein [Clostridium perfringens]|uniref:DUF3801 domain-containing protein n=1 Tax=Clostridium TaxID=1485 RepID=UPI0018E45754|nr:MULTISPECIES: DUF3801 domain-containing protein [Clostridium]ELC8368291.1 DUF3801 domain-containing protein [Clostridium perfringens]MBI6111846.1 DUF3801 domain-containing protein [Clostridium perfringens]MBI6114901.1 DUF3801 domain-containing protein [Clostridium perfringens]MDK0888319.1 DUF3801 domain-containing protein [Clostridium perfringens]WVM62275.1 DUF3801 domain-containing protein [Clostridium perfringens]
MAHDTGSDLASIVANISADILKDGTKVTGNLTKEILLALLSNAKNRKDFKPGKTNLKQLLKSGQEIKMVELSEKDVKSFSSKAKKLGIAFAVIKEKDKDKKTILFKNSDIELVKKTLEELIDNKVEISKENDISESKEEKTDNNLNEKVQKDSLEERIKEMSENQNQKFYLADEKDLNNFVEIQNFVENEKESIPSYQVVSIYENLSKKDTFDTKDKGGSSELETPLSLYERIEEKFKVENPILLTEKEFKEKLNSIQVDKELIQNISVNEKPNIKEEVIEDAPTGKETVKEKSFKSNQLKGINKSREKEKPSVKENLARIKKENAVKREQMKQEKSKEKSKVKELDR